MFKVVALALAVVLVWPATSVAQSNPTRWQGWCDYKGLASPAPRLNLPTWVCETAYEAKLHIKYTPYTRINPFFVSGDFNGDGKTDIALWVTNGRTRQRGIVILHQGSKAPIVIAAGAKTAGRGADFTGLDWWSTLAKGDVLDSTWEDHRKVVLPVDAIVTGKFESASVAIYWNGTSYQFYQLTD